jgi:hypothetical protein
LDREHVQKLLFGEAKNHPYRGLVGWVPKTKDSMLSAAEATPIKDSSAAAHACARKSTQAEQPNRQT